MIYDPFSQFVPNAGGRLWARLLFSLVVIAGSAACPANGQTANPAPKIFGHLPSQAVEGATVPITIDGSGFISSTVILVKWSGSPDHVHVRNVGRRPSQRPGWFHRQSIRPGAESYSRRRNQCRDPDTRSDFATHRDQPQWHKYGHREAGGAGELLGGQYRQSSLGRRLASSRRRDADWKRVLQRFQQPERCLHSANPDAGESVGDGHGLLAQLTGVGDLIYFPAKKSSAGGDFDNAYSA